VLGFAALAKIPLGASGASGAVELLVTESGSASDAASVAATYNVGRTETGSAGDSFPAGLALSLTETGSASDFAGAPLAVSQSESGSASAAQSAAIASSAASIAEYGFAADAPTTSWLATDVFSAVVQAALKGDVVNACYGVQFSFASGPVSVWQGIGPLDASAFSGPTFQGLGNFGRIGAVQLGTVAQTDGISFELSGLDATFFSLAQSQQAQVRGRLARLYLLFFSASWSLLACGVRRTFLMDKMQTKINAAADPPTMIVSLSCEPILASKNKAPWTFLTDADQRGRYGGDRGLERAALLTQKQTMVW